MITTCSAPIRPGGPPGRGGRQPGRQRLAAQRPPRHQITRLLKAPAGIAAIDPQPIGHHLHRPPADLLDRGMRQPAQQHMLTGRQPPPPGLPALHQLQPLGIAQRIGVQRVELIQRRIHRVAQGDGLAERSRTHTRNISAATDKSKPQRLPHNAIRAYLSTTTNPSTDNDQSRKTS
jgi:hypothetical protein